MTIPPITYNTVHRVVWPDRWILKADTFAQEGSTSGGPVVKCNGWVFLFDGIYPGGQCNAGHGKCINFCKNYCQAYNRDVADDDCKGITYYEDKTCWLHTGSCDSVTTDFNDIRGSKVYELLPPGGQQ